MDMFIFLIVIMFYGYKHMSKIFKLYTLNIYSLFYVNYKSTMLQKEAIWKDDKASFRWEKIVYIKPRVIR